MTLDPASPIRIEKSGSGPTRVVLVHGFGANATFWRHWVPTLSRRSEVWNVELMGFGRASSPPDGDFSPPAQARALVRVLQAAAGPPTVLVGHSLGGAVVLISALLLRDAGAPAPKGLVIVSGAALPQRLPPFISLARIPGLGLPFVLFPPPRRLFRAAVRGIVHDPSTVTEAQLEGYFAPLRSRSRRRDLLRAARQLDPTDREGWSARYGEVESPTLLLWGAEDRVIRPEIAERLEQLLGDVRRVTLPGIGHLPPEEAPRASLGHVLEFLDALQG